MPRDIHNVYIYECFNTGSWSVVIGSPMLLFFQHLEASATILSIAACLAPTLNILQIPAAHYVEKVGYRRFVVSGWTARSFVVVAMVIVALLPESMDRATRMVMMLVLGFCYNSMRGVSVAGFLPWFTHIVPESRRGEFLAKDQVAGATAGIACLFAFGSLIHGTASHYSFAILFAISATCGFISIYFLRRIPDVPVEKIAANPEKLPWREMLFYPPFFHYMRYNVVVCAALGASGVFYVRFFRVSLNITDANVLYVAGLTTMVTAFGLFIIGPLLDRAGNKPALTLSGIIFVCHFAGWACIAAKLLPPSYLMFTYQTITAGLAGALWNLANVRIVMGIVPAMGRPHFLALYSAAGSLTVGLIPLAWGWFIDGLGHWHCQWGPWEWNSFSIFYCVLAATMVAALVLLRSVVEPATMTWDVFMTELLVKTPSRAISRLIVRLRGPSTG